MRDTLRSPRQQQLRALLLDLRKRHHLTQAHVARRLAKPQSFVAKYEGGERRLSVIEFIDVVRARAARKLLLVGGYIKIVAPGENSRNGRRSTQYTLI